jgi:hypothetical protein
MGPVYWCPGCGNAGHAIFNFKRMTGFVCCRNGKSNCVYARGGIAFMTFDRWQVVAVRRRLDKLAAEWREYYRK